MRPLGVDNAPYFAAFVASAWSTSAIYCCSGPQLDHWPGNVDPPAERRQLLAHQRRQLGAFPAAAGEQAVDAAKRLDAASHRLDEAWQTVRPRQLHDRLDYAEQVHGAVVDLAHQQRSEEHTSELQSLMRISYAVFCLNKNTKTKKSPT